MATLRPEDRTTRMETADPSPAGDSSDGIPISTDEADREATPEPVVVEPIAQEPTRKLAPLTLQQKFAVLWLLESAALIARVPLEVEMMPAVNPTGVHLFSSDWRALSRWLRELAATGFRKVRLDLALPVDLYESGLFLLTSVAQTVPLIKNRVIEAGAREYVYLPFRED